jgi:hypothetical protein
MITECPFCHSSDIDLARGRCNNCGKPLSLEPAASTPQPEESAPPTPIFAPPAVSGSAPSALPRIAGAAAEGDWQVWENAVFDAYNDGFRIITLIGFSSAGKTFFANRLRRELRLSTDWTAWPGEKATILLSDQAIDWTEIVRHRGGKRRYLVADVDGEAYRRSVGQMLGQPGDSQERRYTLLTALASAYVLMLPARTALEEKQDDFQTEKLVDRFDVIVGVILALERRLKDTNDLRTAIAEPITEAESRKAMREGIDCKRPVHVVFAKADEFDDAAKYDADPYSYAIRHAGSLYHTINKHFATHRFDFVSAFYGYQENMESRVDYQCPSYGTLAAFDWIDRAVSRGVLSKHATAAAKATRKLFDSAFRKTLPG